MKHFIVSLLFILVLTVISCSRVHYIGDSHPQTGIVKSYYSAQDVPFEFITIGQAVISGGNVSKMSEKLTEKAKQTGADAILFQGVDTDNSGSDSGANTRRVIKASFLKKS